MQLNTRFNEVFGKIPILGMIHLSGDDKVSRALKEINTFEEEGMDGIIVENYHSSVQDVIDTLEEVSKRNNKIVVGVNILPNEFSQSFNLANKYGADFIQIDQVSGKYREGELDLELFKSFKEKFPNIITLGGVWPKYYHPIPDSNLEKDLQTAMERVEAIVVTGDETGKEIPIEKILNFRDVINYHPLIIGAGLNLDNVYEQLCLADGAIVGSTFKFNNDTRNSIDQKKIKDFMEIVKEVRAYKSSKE
jgi:uncharacterized protein